jgi:hypothetical protein
MGIIAVKPERALDDLHISRACRTMNLKPGRPTRIRLTRRDDIRLPADAFAALHILKNRVLTVYLAGPNFVLTYRLEVARNHSFYPADQLAPSHRQASRAPAQHGRSARERVSAHAVMRAAIPRFATFGLEDLITAELVRTCRIERWQAFADLDDILDDLAAGADQWLAYQAQYAVHPPAHN